MKIYCSKYLIKISALALCFGSLLNAQVTDTIHISANWNMVSLPVEVQDAYYLTLFPGVIYKAWSYDPPNETDTIRLGKSYWIKFFLDTTYLITGEPIHSIIINLPYAGWHMVGSISYPVPVNNIQIDPYETMRSDFFEYNPASGYEKSDTIKPGVGYWIKVDRSCKLILISMGYPCPEIPTVEYEGKTYNTAQIGNQCWLRENLDVGTIIQGSDTAKDNGIIEKYCYNNDHVNCNTYGGLYQWDEAMQYMTIISSGQGICPNGWHLPTINDIEYLKDAINNDGNALKEIGQGTGAGAGTNISGFSALFSGIRLISGIFSNILNFGLWNSSDNDYMYADYFSLSKSSGIVNSWYYFKIAGLGVRCIKNGNSPLYPPSNPNPPDNSFITDTSYSLSWTCDNPEGKSLTYDVYFGKIYPPDVIISSNQVETSIYVSNLDSNTIYYWYVVVKENDADTTIGPVWNFKAIVVRNPCPGIPNVEYGGKIYNTVQIGSQCWFKENLDVGIMIDSLQNATNNDTIEKYCYNHDTVKCNIYGGLYQWDEAMQYNNSDKAQGVCPPGWHISSDGEFSTLYHLVRENVDALKAVSQPGGTNKSGFSLLLAGFRYLNGKFGNLNRVAYIYSSTEWYTPDKAFCWEIWYDSSISGFSPCIKSIGASIRCIKD